MWSAYQSEQAKRENRSEHTEKKSNFKKNLTRTEDMDLNTETTSNGLLEINLKKLHKVTEELSQAGKLILRFLTLVLVLVTDLFAGLLGSGLFRRHFHLVVSGMVLFGPALSLWVSKYSIFANKNHYLYRTFLRSGWGWTCVFSGSFVFLLSFSIRRSLSLSLCHLSRIAAVGALWWGTRRLLALLENAAGSCYESLPVPQDGSLAPGSGSAGQPLLLFHQGESKASCLKAGMLWHGWEVSEDVLLLCLCCLLLAEEISVFGPHLALERVLGNPLRLLFFLCVSLLCLWLFLLLCLLAHFPQFPSQQLGGALAYLAWRGLYQGWYCQKPNWYCPGRPGEGLTNTGKQAE